MARLHVYMLTLTQIYIYIYIYIYTYMCIQKYARVCMYMYACTHAHTHTDTETHTHTHARARVCIQYTCQPLKTSLSPWRYRGWNPCPLYVIVEFWSETWCTSAATCTRQLAPAVTPQLVEWKSSCSGPDEAP